MECVPVSLWYHVGYAQYHLSFITISCLLPRSAVEPGHNIICPEWLLTVWSGPTTLFCRKTIRGDWSNARARSNDLTSALVRAKLLYAVRASLTDY